MKKYIITDIGDDDDIDEFERLGLGIQAMDTNMKFNVDCIDKYEYVEGEKARKNGDIIEGNLYIKDAEFVEKTNLEFMHKWTGLERAKLSPEVELVVKVTKIINDYNILATSDFNKEIPIRFSILSDKINTNRTYFKEGDKILLSKATLCLDIWGYEV